MHSGATRLHFIVGDPVAQTRSPAGLTLAFAARGADAICIALQAAPDDFDAVMRAVQRMRNVDGVVITVPHKFAAFSQCGRATDRARTLGAVNVMRREDGGWYGDMTDGAGAVAALRAQGAEPRGARALLVGAGGAGSAVALALVGAGVRELAVCDLDSTRCDRLVGKLPRSIAVRATSPDPRGFDLVVNATPAGLQPDEPPPVDPARLDPGAAVVDLVTAVADTALVAGARGRGCKAASGHDVFDAQSGIIADFLLARTAVG